MSRHPMSRPYAMARLLEHGSLTSAQLRQITGWDARIVGNVLHTLMGDGTVAITNVQGRRHYLLAAHLRRPTTPSTRTP